jgi:hypothetical protein
MVMCQPNRPLIRTYATRKTPHPAPFPFRLAAAKRFGEAGGERENCPPSEMRACDWEQLDDLRKIHSAPLAVPISPAEGERVRVRGQERKRTHQSQSNSPRVFLRFASVLLCALPLRADDWPQWLGPQRDSVWRETGIVRNFPPTARRCAGALPLAGLCRPAVAKGKVYVTDRQLAEGRQQSCQSV